MIKKCTGHLSALYHWWYPSILGTLVQNCPKILTHTSKSLPATAAAVVTNTHGRLSRLFVSTLRPQSSQEVKSSLLFSSSSSSSNHIFKQSVIFWQKYLHICTCFNQKKTANLKNKYNTNTENVLQSSDPWS